MTTAASLLAEHLLGVCLDAAPPPPKRYYVAPGGGGPAECDSLFVYATGITAMDPQRTRRSHFPVQLCDELPVLTLCAERWYCVPGAGNPTPPPVADLQALALRIVDDAWRTWNEIVLSAGWYAHCRPMSAPDVTFLGPGGALAGFKLCLRFDAAGGYAGS